MPDGGVGIVVVSHSRALAEAALGLAQEMVQGRPVRIELAAGLDETTFGTDAVAVKAAVEAVDGPAGVVVLVDLGSAVMSAELALELLDDDAVRERVLLSPAPLVEGLVVAAVAAAGGATRQQVAADAETALLAKVSALSPAVSGEPAAAADAEVTGRFTVSNRHGLHARPAARLLAGLDGVAAEVVLTNLTTGAGTAPADSMIQLALLGAEQGHEIEVGASGPQAQQVLERVLAMAAEGFGDTDD